MNGAEVAAFEPGQYIGVRLIINGQPTYRHYSLSDVPNGHSYRISVKREDTGHVSRFLHDHTTEGFELDLLPPAGSLTLQGDEPLLLISGGVGQTPLLPMAKHAVSEGARWCTSTRPGTRITMRSSRSFPSFRATTLTISGRW